MRKLATAEIRRQRNKIAPQDTMTSGSGVLLVLDNIRSIHNVGAMFRTADAAGVDKIYLCGITGTPHRAEINKTALGTVPSTAWEYYPSTKEVILQLKREKNQIVALEITDQSQDFPGRQSDFFHA